MTETMEKPRCQCGQPMQVTARGGQFCENCDRPQAQERLGIPRIKTRADVRFEMFWVREEANYEDNTASTTEEGDNDG